jgi:antitoxin component YwqK of YwqJK toxin-antitoxin module
MRNGKPHGTVTYFYMNGAKWEEYTYEDGILQGPYRKWDPEGRHMSPSGEFVDGEFYYHNEKKPKRKGGKKRE